MTFNLTRRAALGAAAALPFASAASPLLAAGSGTKANSTIAKSFTLGDFTVTTLLDGSIARDGAKEIFGGGATDEEFAKVSADNFIPADAAQFFFTPSLVNTGSELVLFDTGLGQGGIQAALADAGVTPDQIDVVVLTHMHPDHIGGMTTNDAPTFANARYVTAAPEYDFWAAQEAGNRVGDLVAAKVTPLAEKMSFIGDGGEVTSGITAVAAYGHTPGHTVYHLESNGQRLILTADLANHYVWSFAHPEWEVRFDMDKAAATAARRNVLGMLAADKVPMVGYHMPFPGAGFVETRGDGFRFVPVSYQMMG
ncbi:MULTISPECIES: MBL fold metallo-hydrolase [unclassified Ruegeria]|uniref:MBL fold metallo-hydrolase n=1 Tax=unclassified Ruegeria TaxID=2625375 RepID=UPI001490D384|nr:MULTISPECIES: MBL fold metallo-hydrolase [unclassified Ruegeria]NOD47884.1 MBL fold metallo-hydrolase [Ruegeria sp. HKCCD5849]NOD52868.1 MBL fold metallo-hydrolase [Ruegeria sp. HKCCD5851]NOD69014.1 MBL fold metallo-hydrolase [Ruegeria sp. HKCCD7303]